MITWIKKYPVTTFLVASNVVLFAAMVIATGPQTLLGPPVSDLIHWGANFGPMALTNEPWRLLSNAFVHCHLLHLLLNMYALFVVGPDLEQRIGKVQYSLLYIITALGGSLLSVEFHPVQVSAGASGAIFGLVGCYLAYIPPQFAKQGKKTLKRRIMVLFLFLAINFAFAQIVGNVDNAAHMGGLITGLLFGWVASKTTLKDRPLLAYMNSL